MDETRTGPGSSTGPSSTWTRAEHLRLLFSSSGHSSGDHIFDWRLEDILLITCFSIPTLCLMLYLVRMLYRCCCSRNYAEWRADWSLFLQSVLSRRYRRKREIDPAKLFDMMPIKLNGHTEEIESVCSSLESPFVATHCVAGDLIVWDALSGECHTVIRRHGPVATAAGITSSGRLNSVHNFSRQVSFQPHHRPTDSCSSDSTYGSSPSSSNSDTSFETPFTSSADQPLISSHLLSESQATSAKNHRRHHSLSSISTLTAGRNNSVVASATNPFRSHNNRGYDFSPYVPSRHSSRELLTDLVRSAASSVSGHTAQSTPVANYSVESQLTHKAIWTMEMFGRHVYIGCENGRIEVWDALTGSLSYFNDRSISNNSSMTERSCSDIGVTVIRVNNTKMIVGYLDGILETYQSEPRNHFTHTLTPGSRSFRTENSIGNNASHHSPLFYTLCHVTRAHRQPITVMEINSCYIVTGSLDHLVKVFSLDGASQVYTLNGHCGGVTALEMDPMSPMTAVTGCQVGQFCVWDLQTGTCLLSVEAHRGASISSILTAPHHIVTSGTDDRIFVWDKQSGKLMHSFNQVSYQLSGCQTQLTRFYM